MLALAPVAACVVAACVIVAGCGWPASGSDVIVFAVGSLARPLEQIAERFEAETGLAVVISSSRSDTLVTRLLGGAPADLFVSADATQMERAIGAGLVDTDSRVRLLSDRLVVIVPAASQLPFQVPADLAAPAVRRFALSDPSVEPAGRHAVSYLQTRGIWAALEARVTRFASATAATTAVSLGTADAGIVYRSDARSVPGVRTLLDIDADPRWTVAYQAVLLRRAPHADAARRFLARLQQPDSMTLFEEAGFVALAARAS